jgi:hypothetical protein
LPRNAEAIARHPTGPIADGDGGPVNVNAVDRFDSATGQLDFGAAWIHNL